MFVFFPIIISLFALGISIYNSFRDSRAERFELDFDLVKWFGNSEREGIADYLWLAITNNSKLPCSILEISLVVENSDGNITRGIGRGNKALVITSITKSLINDNKNIKETYSLDYPQNIDAYSCLGGYFHFYSSDNFYNFEDRNAKVTIKTNRGVFTKDVFLDIGKNVFRALQYMDLDEFPITTNIPIITNRDDGSEIVYIKDGI